jgi:GNAT superfamily N-acetyltransferase
MIHIRPFDFNSDQDYQSMIDIYNANWPDQPASASYEKRTDSLRVAEHYFRRLLVVLDVSTPEPGRVVAFADYGHMPWSFHPCKYYCNVQVHPEFQNQGIGTTLYNQIVGDLTHRDPESLESATREDKTIARGFLERRGFTVASRTPNSELDPALFDPAEFVDVVERVRSEGIAIRNFADLDATYPDHLRRLYDLELETMQDVPWHNDFTAMPFEQYVKSYQDNPDLLPRGYLVALDGDRYVGLTQLWGSDASDAIIYTGFTAVARAYRRQGIATALKALAIGYAKILTTSEGRPPVIRTSNEETNPMFQLNLRLGFREQPAWLIYRKPLSDAATS